MYDFLIVGAGITGATIAERLAKDGKKVLIIDKRDHIGGNCYDYTDENSITVQKYGPHIFHTKEKKVFEYISKFTEFTDYKHKVIAKYKGKYYPIPINLDTVNMFFGLGLKDENELKEFLETKRENITDIKNSRDVVVSKFGVGLYNAFVKHYTKKQWDKFPEELDKSVLERLPIRHDKNSYYFDDKFQGMPKEGFTKIFEKMLDNKNIDIKLGVDFFKIKETLEYDKLVFTGELDRFFNYKFGKLDYRCIDFVFETKDGDFQPNSVVNHTDKDVKFIRVTEFKKFYNKKSNKTIICKELFTWRGEPSHPVMDEKNKTLAQKYIDETKKLKGVYFAGRLGSYKYLNIDTAIMKALTIYDLIKEEEK